LAITQAEIMLELTKMTIENRLIKESKTELFGLVDKVFSVPTVTVTNEKVMNVRHPVTGGGDNMGNAYGGMLMDSMETENETITTKESK